MNPCLHCNHETDTHRDICTVCEDESEIGFKLTPVYDGAIWDELYASLETENVG